MIKIIKTWCENSKEGCTYLKFNKYGKFVFRIFKSSYFICVGGSNENEVKDVIVLLRV